MTTITHAAYANPDGVADRTMPHSCPERERLDHVITDLVTADDCLEDNGDWQRRFDAAVKAVQAHVARCGVCKGSGR
jgi:hypothetical protein